VLRTAGGREEGRKCGRMPQICAEPHMYEPRPGDGRGGEPTRRARKEGLAIGKQLASPAWSSNVVCRGFLYVKDEAGAERNSAVLKDL